jgi:hypothetical protein
MLLKAKPPLGQLSGEKKLKLTKVSRSPSPLKDIRKSSSQIRLMTDLNNKHAIVQLKEIDNNKLNMDFTESKKDSSSMV